MKYYEVYLTPEAIEPVIVRADRVSIGIFGRLIFTKGFFDRIVASFQEWDRFEEKEKSRAPSIIAPRSWVPSRIIRVDPKTNRCDCDVDTKCPLGKTGHAVRCSATELSAAKIKHEWKI